MPDAKMNHSGEVRVEAGRLLSAWRSGTSLDADQLCALKKMLTTTVLLHRRNWARNVDDGASAVVGAGVDLLAGSHLDGPAADVVMSAVMIHDLAGNLAARLVLDHARMRLRERAA